MLEVIEEEKDGEDEGAGDGKAAVVEGKVQIAAAEQYLLLLMFILLL